MPNNVFWGQINGYNWNANWQQGWGNQQAAGVPNPQQQAVDQLGQMYNVFAAPAQAPAVPPPAPVAIEDLDLPVEEGDMINDFRVGCDPEFMLLHKVTGLTDVASRYFPHNGEIGYDHGGRVAEFRPGPSKGVLPIVKKIQELVRKANLKAPNTRLRSGAICNQDCLGGHVHFGFNCFEEKPPHNCSILAGMGGRFNERGAKVTKALDAVTKTLEHLDILPKAESAQRRGHGQNYGRYGDVRDCNGHMEYRTMASWLYDPKVAFLCLTAAKVAAADPDGTNESLRRVGGAGWLTFKGWLEQYANKDVNASRACTKLLDRGLVHVQVDPTVDFKERWEDLGV